MRFSDEAVLRLLVSVVLGAVIGAERETNEQPAGLRTHIAVCLGACIFGVVSTLGFSEFQAVRASTNVQIDVTRVASQVVVGIGFLGAGMIFRQGAVVRNLTTAASLWVTSAVGLMAGVGDLWTAAVAAVVVVATLTVLKPLRNWIRRNFAKDERELRIRLAPGVGPDEMIGVLRALDGVEVSRLAIEKEDGQFVLDAELRAHRHVPLDEKISTIALRPEVVDLGGLAGHET
jgi:putative Mg2+ transporter-C (MgtC) family protein